LSAGAAKREVIQSLLYRIGGMGLGFIATGVLIRELGAASYGTWAALTSLLAWIQLSDFGVGYALKNRIASASKPQEMLRLVSGVFQFYALIAIFFVIFFLLFGNLLAIVKDYRPESLLLYIGTIIFFPLTIGAAVLQGMRKNSLSSLISFLQSIFWVIIILLLAWTHTSLLLLSLLNISLVLLMGIGQCALSARVLVGDVRKAFVEIFNFSNLRLALPLWSVGIRFILLQLSSVILFSLGTYLTYSNLSSAEAAKYDILFKLFQVPLTFFNVVISVYWVEITKAIAINDRQALQKRFVQLQLIALCVSLIMLLFSLFIASPLIDVYTSGEISTSVSDALAFWVLIMIQSFSYSGAVFLNAAEKLHGQIIFAVVAAALLIPTVLLFYAYGMGFSAVPLATAALIMPSLFYCNFSAYRHVIKKAD
jgi:O-antigen/teichoic acid export membrane protein